jgi:two-component system LytT family sensor kinase
MKVKWREHEIILVTMLLVLLAGHDIQAAVRSSAVPLNWAGGPVLLPQIGSLLLLYGCYLWINLGIMPGLRRKVLDQAGMPLLRTLLFAGLQICVICFLLGPGVNFASFYINSHYIQHDFILPLTFGYHPQPFANTFGGLDMSIGLVLMYLICIVVRDMMIHQIGKSAYRTMVAGRVTAVLLLYFFVLAFFDVVYEPNGAVYHFYFGCVPSFLLVVFTNLYWLFPSRDEGSLFKWKLLGPLLLSSFIYSFVFSVGLHEDWSYLHVMEIWAFALLIITPLSWLDYRRQRKRILHVRGMEKELLKSKADLQFLRSQINPHFLFNALNTLYGTALLEGSKNTATGIQKLGDMMRFMLHENNLEFIPMSKEIDYLRNYISLQRLRVQVSPEIVIEDTITVVDCEYSIAPMLLIPFVENAFKHGISLDTRSWIKIWLRCEKGKVWFEVRNSMHAGEGAGNDALGHGNDPKAGAKDPKDWAKNPKDWGYDPERERSGIGLKNVSERLKLLYPDKHEISIGNDEKEFFVRLEISL